MQKLQKIALCDHSDLGKLIDIQPDDLLYLQIFGDFFQEMQGRALNAEEQQVMNKIAEEMEEE